MCKGIDLTSPYPIHIRHWVYLELEGFMHLINSIYLTYYSKFISLYLKVLKKNFSVTLPD